MSVQDKILKLTKQLLPTGRAWRMPKDGVFDKLSKALARSEARVYADALSVLDSALPDNNNFTADDATDWERRLGLITNTSLSLATRKQVIQRKMAHPGTIKARQHYLYIEGQLQAAGFDVYVHENRFPYGDGSYITYPPEAVGGSGATFLFQHGDAQHGEFQHGDGFNNKVVNYIDEDLDNLFDIGSNYKFTFFIGAAYLGDYADVPTGRREEFRQLILRLKPVQCVGFLFINYV
jgi:uncharacterized protein YmfQ (DUF2313 family)